MVARRAGAVGARPVAGRRAARLHAPWRHRRGRRRRAGVHAARSRSVGADIVRVATADGAVDVRIVADAPVIVRVVESARRGGSRGDTTVTTFAARLRQLEGTRVHLGLRAPPTTSSTASCSSGATR